MKPTAVGLLLGCLMRSSAILAQDPSPGCDLGFDGSARSSAKNRKPSDGTAYEVHGDIDHPLSIADWFTLTCSLDKKPGLPPKVKDKQDTLPGIETTTVTVKGFVVAAKWDDDNDSICSNYFRREITDRNPDVVERRELGG